MYYNQVLGNLQLVEADAAEAGLSSNNVAALAKILKAKSFFELSSIWGDIPFSEALDGATYPSPGFDTQEEVFKGAVEILDEAMALIDAMPADGVFDLSVGDLIYGGDMDKWRRWANSLKIRILMLVRNKDTSVDSKIVAALSEPLIESNDQGAMLRYLDTPAEKHAFQRFIEAFFGIDNESAPAFAPAPVLYDLLKDKADPRFDVLIHEPNDLGGAPMGDVATADDVRALISINVIRNDLPHVMLLPSEISFYRAELALLGVTSEDAQGHFETGLKSILSFWGGEIPGSTASIDATVINDYVANYGTATLQDVREQLFLEAFMRPVVSWNSVRRTKVPEMETVPGTSISSILKRFNYPPDEVAANPNTPANLPTDAPQWFEN